MTDNGLEFCATDAHAYEIYLALNDVGHRRTKDRRSQTKGFVERFNKTVLDEFFREEFRKKLFESVGGLQKDSDEWLDYYNNKRAHQGYRNMDKCPTNTMKKYSKVFGLKPKSRLF